MADPKDPSAVDDLKARLEREALRIGAEKAANEAMAGIGRAAGSALDGLERALFGKVGGAEEVIRREETADPLERLRREVGVERPAAPPPPSKEDALARAKKELEALKLARAAKSTAGAEPNPTPKKSL